MTEWGDTQTSIHQKINVVMYNDQSIAVAFASLNGCIGSDGHYVDMHTIMHGSKEPTTFMNGTKINGSTVGKVAKVEEIWVEMEFGPVIRETKCWYITEDGEWFHKMGCSKYEGACPQSNGLAKVVKVKAKKSYFEKRGLINV